MDVNCGGLSSNYIEDIYFVWQILVRQMLNITYDIHRHI